MRIQLNVDEVFGLVEKHLKEKGFTATNISPMLSGYGDLEFDGIQADVQKPTKSLLRQIMDDQARVWKSRLNDAEAGNVVNQTEDPKMSDAAFLGPPTLLIQPCPVCKVEQVGWPIQTDSGQTTEHWGPDGWVYRMDRQEWVCPTCHENLGPDQVREDAIAQFTNDTAPTPPVG